MFTTPGTFLLAAVLTVSSSSFAVAQDRSGDADLKELASYTLTVDTINKMERVTKVMVASLQNDPRYVEQRKLENELDALEQKDNLTDAEQRRIDAINARMEQLENADDDEPDSDSGDSLSDMARKIANTPPLAAALKQVGMTPREYAKASMAIFQAGFALAAKQMTEKMGKPFKTPEGVNPANIKFFQEHEADLKRMQAAMQSAGGG
jgi:hypothetical protein